MDAEYLAVQRSLHILLIRRNSFTTINRLPVEILAQIFTIYAEDTRRRWRRPRSASPALDNGDVRARKLRAEEMYRRSQSAPVDVYLTENEPSPSNHDLILRHLSLTRALTIHTETMCSSSSPFWSENCPAPVLETLSIMVDDRAAQLNYLGACAPALRTLKIKTSCPDLPWTAALFTQLASLDIEYRGYHLNSFLDDSLNALEHMDRLESLRLDSAIPDPPPFRTNTRPVVVLSRLKSLKIEGDVTPTTQFIKYFRAPACIKLCLVLVIRRCEESEIRESFARATAWTHANCPLIPQAARVATQHHQHYRDLHF
ncbi:hypothetical protein FA95DRAFT_1604159 [Auriscalpium vulgare]|uniref:Uncharacterized protein n=1 Tax=Auriscalpium vulgare TaxID=40419 RepID=A0ACB8RZG5_9AGAM|nr:hypothetical protein FA95DRAFT_1604159 [Auriscalpium vulgare]